MRSSHHSRRVALDKKKTQAIANRRKTGGGKSSATCVGRVAGRRGPISRRKWYEREVCGVHNCATRGGCNGKHKKMQFVLDGLPAGGPDLAAGLAEVDEKAFTHLGLL